MSGVGSQVPCCIPTCWADLYLERYRQRENDKLVDYIVLSRGQIGALSSESLPIGDSTHHQVQLVFQRGIDTHEVDE